MRGLSIPVLFSGSRGRSAPGKGQDRLDCQNLARRPQQQRAELAKVETTLREDTSINLLGRLGGEVERIEALGLGETRQPNAPLHVAALAVDALEFAQAQQIARVIGAVLCRLSRRPLAHFVSAIDTAVNEPR